MWVVVKALRASERAVVAVYVPKLIRARHCLSATSAETRIGKTGVVPSDRLFAANHTRVARITAPSSGSASRAATFVKGASARPATMTKRHPAVLYYSIFVARRRWDLSESSAGAAVGRTKCARMSFRQARRFLACCSVLRTSWRHTELR